MSRNWKIITVSTPPSWTSTTPSLWTTSITWRHIPEPIRSILLGIQEDIKTLLGLETKLAPPVNWQHESRTYGLEIWDERPDSKARTYTCRLATLYITPEIIEILPEHANSIIYDLAQPGSINDTLKTINQLKKAAKPS